MTDEVQPTHGPAPPPPQPTSLDAQTNQVYLTADGKPVRDEGGNPTRGNRPTLSQSAEQMKSLVGLAQVHPAAARLEAEQLLVAALRDVSAVLNDAGRQAVSDLLHAYDRVRDA